MFICEKCERNSQAGESPVRVVLERRTCGHPVRKDDKGGQGTQIVTEANWCSTCALTIKPVEASPITVFRVGMVESAGGVEFVDPGEGRAE